MASTIKIKRSSVPNKVPTTSDINAGELALNLYDRKLYSSTGSAVFEIGNSGSNGSILGSYSTTALGDLTRNSNVVTSVTYTPANRYLQVANAVVTYATKISPTTSGILAHTGRATISTNLTVSGNTVVSGLVANGSLGTAGHYLRTNGTTTYWSPAAAGSSGASWAALTSTNTAIRTLVSDRLQVANAVATYATKVSPTTSGVLAHTGRATISTNLTVSGNTVIGRLVANGSLGTSNYVLKTNGTTVFWGAASTPAYVTQSLGSLTRSSNVVTSITSLADGVAIAPSNLYLQVANAVSTYATKASMAIKTFNITGSFSGPVSGTFRYVPLSSVTITKVQLTNQSAVTGDLVIGLNKNGSQLTTYTLSSGNYTQTYTGQNYAITSSDYITVDVVSGSGANFSLVLAA